MTLSADRLSYSYSQKVRLKPDTTFALHDVSVSIAPGSLTGLLGPNGCGKTTLLKLLSGVLKPELGSVRLGEREVRLMSPRAVAQQIAVVPQETHPARSEERRVGQAES